MGVFAQNEVIMFNNNKQVSAALIMKAQQHALKMDCIVWETFGLKRNEHVC